MELRIALKIYWTPFPTAISSTPFYHSLATALILFLKYLASKVRDRCSLTNECTAALALMLVFLVGCNTDSTRESSGIGSVEAEAFSIDGEPLYRTTFSPDRLESLTADYSAAKMSVQQFPDSVDAHIWFGRRAGYLWRYREAINIFTQAITMFPEDARLYRHRGHRFITLRKFDLAIEDLRRAAELIAGTPDQVEPDGAPNAAGIPTSTLHTNIWYHLGLAHYLQHDFARAISAFENCLAAATNNDMRVATVDWLYMSLRRAGRVEEASALLTTIASDLELLENHAYYRRILMYKGLAEPESLLAVEDDVDRSLTLATQGYGVANWYLYNSDTLRALEILRDVVEGEYWPSFGYIAAESDLAQLD